MAELFGARYYDARTSVWQSPDPILNEYIVSSSNNIHLSRKLAVYSYARQTPLIMLDPDGNDEIYYDQSGSEVNRVSTTKWYNPSTWKDNKFIQGSKPGQWWPTSENIQSFFDKEGPLTGVVESNVESNIDNFVNAHATSDNKNMARKNPVQAIGDVLENSPQKGSWDYKRNLDKSKMYILDGKAYFHDFIGNVAWGKIMKHLGFDSATAAKGAGIYQSYQDLKNLQFGNFIKNLLTNPVSNDDSRDTEAIMRGYESN